jgi:tRNA (mo5U34)-methyltransferase
LFSFSKALNHKLPSIFVEWLKDAQIKSKMHQKNGRYNDWSGLLNRLPDATPTEIQLNSQAIKIGKPTDLSSEDRIRLKKQLKQLMPWRKGPYSLFGIEIDTEWRSDMKWERVRDFFSSIHHNRVLDVGCGSGYHGWRILGEGAEVVFGVEPYLLNVVQFEAIKKYAGEYPYFMLPVGIEDVPWEIRSFDVVFSMGLLYHRRSPIEHLQQLKSFLYPRGILILETLVVDGDEGYSLVPQSRYAKMRNVWFIPTVKTLQTWLTRSGFKKTLVLDESITTSEEQRKTEWMQFESLDDFLDPVHKRLTIEGYPAPKRTLIAAYL